MLTMILLSIIMLVLFLPLLIRKIEEDLEIFLFIMGVLTITLTSLWTKELMLEALAAPIKITAAVLMGGLIFYFLQKPFAKRINAILNRLGLGVFVFLVVVILGFISSIVTAIVAALVLSEIIGHLKLDKKNETKLVVISCFSIGLGAALTPMGEPLATIAIAKLSGAPYHAGFWFLFKHLWIYIIPSIFVLGFFAVRIIKKGRTDHGYSSVKAEHISNIFVRTLKVYLFVVGLMLLGTGVQPLVDKYIVSVPGWGLYWINLISAALDNATLVAAEISPSMGIIQIKAAILGLIISGGMLVPGNIPNIIVAGKIRIRSRDWAKIGIPIGLVLMAVMFIFVRMLKA